MVFFQQARLREEQRLRELEERNRLEEERRRNEELEKYKDAEKIAEVNRKENNCLTMFVENRRVTVYYTFLFCLCYCYDTLKAYSKHGKIIFYCSRQWKENSLPCAIWCYLNFCISFSLCVFSVVFCYCSLFLLARSIKSTKNSNYCSWMYI